MKLQVLWVFYPMLECSVQWPDRQRLSRNQRVGVGLVGVVEVGCSVTCLGLDLLAGGVGGHSE